MKKIFMNFGRRAGRRVFTFLLAAAMVCAGSTEVFAAAKTGEASTELSGTTKPEDASAGLSGAVNGTPSKVIGINVRPHNYAIYDSTGEKVVATYEYAQNDYEGRTTYLPGEAKDYRDSVTGLYAYNGIYYEDYDSSNGYIYLSNPVVFFDGAIDQTTNLYLVNGKYYSYRSKTKNGIYYVKSKDEIVILGKYPNEDVFYAAHGAKIDPAKSKYDYYQKEGKAYKNWYSKWLNAEETHCFYAYRREEIFLNAAQMRIEWNSVTTGEQDMTPDNQRILVAYELEINGAVFPFTDVVTTDGKFLLNSTRAYPYCPVLKAGESAAIRVRAIYYTQTKTVTPEGKEIITCQTYKTGPWSDTYTYTFPGVKTKEIPALSVTAVQDGDYIKVQWNRNNDVKEYVIEYIYTNVPVALTPDNWDDYHGYSKKAWDALKETYPDLKYVTSSMYEEGTQRKTSWWSKDMPYYYFMVRPYTLTDHYDFTKYHYSNIASVVVVPKGIETPAIADFRVGNDIKGDIVFNWTPVDAGLVIYACEESAFPAYYNYRILDAYAKVPDKNGDLYNKYLTYALDNSITANVSDKIRYCTVNGDKGEYTFEDLEPGKTYYFIAHTYDTTDRNVPKTSPVAVIDGIAYNYYTAMGPASNMVSAKKVIGKPSVITLSGKKSIKLSLSDGSTGYEIYRKSGKKWKKLVTTIDNHYVDEGLKEKKKYSYKVRSYYLNEETGKKSYSEYVNVTATTGTANVVMLKASAKSSKSVKLSWNKVSGATKYEIYRSDEYAGDPAKVYTKYGTENTEDYIRSHKFELVKTVKKSSTTSYTNKGLKAGHDYTYLIKAYYNNGKKTAFIYDVVSVSMQVGVPENIKTEHKGNGVKVSWTKDPYAKSYEVAYMIYDAEGHTDNETYTVHSTKKASYTIGNMEQGGYANVKVRAVGKNGKYSDWSLVYQGVSLAGPKKVKASNVFVKSSSGKQEPAVKITWQKVSGALYYKVYRSTKKPVYYADSKMYGVDVDKECVLIAKESNDDESDDYNEVPYRELENVEGSVTGTSAIDRAQLDTGVDYYYTVVAYGPYGTRIASYASYKNESQRMYGSGGIGKVCFNTKLSVTAKVSKGKVKLTWNKIPGVTKYTIYRATSKKGKYSKVATVKKGKVTWTDKKAKKGKTYYYKIVATGKSALKNKLEVKSAAKKVKAK